MISYHLNIQLVSCHVSFVTSMRHTHSPRSSASPIRCYNFCSGLSSDLRVPSGCFQSFFICRLFPTAACCRHQKHLARRKRTFQDHRLTHTHTQIETEGDPVLVCKLYGLGIGAQFLNRILNQSTFYLTVRSDNGILNNVKKSRIR